MHFVLSTALVLAAPLALPAQPPSRDSSATVDPATRAKVVEGVVREYDRIGGALAVASAQGQLSLPGVTYLDARQVVVSVVPDSLDGVHFDAKIRHKNDWVSFKTRFDPAAVVAWLNTVGTQRPSRSTVLAGLGGREGVVLAVGKSDRYWLLHRLEEEEPLLIRADAQFNDTLLTALRLAAGHSAMDSAAFARGLVAPVEEQPDSCDPRIIDIPTPRYPTDMASHRVQGLVLVRYVVGADGRTEPNSVEPLWASHAEFIPSVRAAVARGRFHPAQQNGKAVRRRVYQKIYFREHGSSSGWN